MPDPTFLQQMNEIVSRISGIVWGWPMLILLVGTGLYLTILLKGIQFTKLPLALRLIFKKEEGEGDISHFAALMTALAATVGNGNIVGVASAILNGGPGAVFWMWMIGLVGMATKYSEAILAVRYRESGEFGMRGGPMYYISKGAGLPWLGVVFAIFAAIAAFGIGNMTQVNSVAGNFKNTFGISPIITGLTLMVLTAMVILGGIRSIGRFSSVLVPFMIVGYVVAALIIIVWNIRFVPEAFGLIFRHAFEPYAVAGGAIGYTMKEAMRYGIARGVFSNESGLGSSPIAAAAAKTNDPATQALVSMTQTFIDTIIVCTMTALVILTTTHWMQPGAQSNLITAAAFSDHLGRTGGIIVALASAIFAYSTLLGWSYYGEKSIEYLLGPRSIFPYRLLFVLAISVGAIVELDNFKAHSELTSGVKLVWDTADVMNALMAIPNLIGLLLLARIIKSETDGYFARQPGRMLK